MKGLFLYNPGLKSNNLLKRVGETFQFSYVIDCLWANCISKEEIYREEFLFLCMIHSRGKIPKFQRFRFERCSRENNDHLRDFDALQTTEKDSILVTLSLASTNSFLLLLYFITASNRSERV